MPVYLTQSQTSETAPLLAPRRFRNFLRRAVEVTGFQPLEASVSFVLLDSDAMTELNGLHLHHDGATDVITYDLRMPGQLPCEAGEVAAEIYICPAVAAKYARKYGQSTSRELCLYAVHGLLHLSGLDDHTPDDRKKMREAEKNTLDLLAKHFDLDAIAAQS